VLAGAGQIRAHRPGAVAGLARIIFRVDPQPFTSFGF
jgi:hypothetical protein